MTLLAGGLAWLVVVVCGFTTLLNYQSAPGEAGAASPSWPTDSCLPRPADRAALVMAVHPHCPCTRASIGELAVVMTRCRDAAAAYVLFLKPNSFDKDWVTTDLWRSAAAIPGVSVVCDEGGVESRRFGALTSGQVALYDRRGQLLFRGGMTGSRGHSGDNAGRSAVISLATTGLADRREAFVFGCPLFGPSCQQPGVSQPCQPQR